MTPSDLEMVGRLALAAVLGGLIGLERESHGQAAGLRTHMVVSLGASLVMLVSFYVNSLSPEKADPGRIAAQVVTGIGFLGAGAIIRFGMSIKGLTTAACLWTAAGIGLAAGCGYWKAAVVTTAFTLVATFFLDKLEKTVLHGRAFRKVVIHSKDTAGMVGRVEHVLGRFGLNIREVDIQRDRVEKKLQITILATCEENTDVDALTRQVTEIPDVEKVEIE
jgi:putative Mg2+ transporter-C (MgtC) family protein